MTTMLDIAIPEIASTVLNTPTPILNEAVFIPALAWRVVPRMIEQNSTDCLFTL